MSVNAVQYRRDLHRMPELDDELPDTTAYVRKVLEPLGAEIFSPIKGSVCAYFDAGADETVALRADMDALPVTECTGLFFASERPGRMHACGHDGHTAIELGLAEETARMLAAGERLPRNVLFVFQPAEETTGGAGRLCETGVFERYGVTRVFGLHLWPNLPEGSVWSRPGPMMARSNEVTLRVTGKSVHVSRAAEGLDALRAGVDWMNAAYAWTEALPDDVLRTLQFGRMTAGTVRNAVAGSAEIQGTLRTYDEDAAEMIRGGSGRSPPKRPPARAAGSKSPSARLPRRLESRGALCARLGGPRRACAEPAPRTRPRGGGLFLLPEACSGRLLLPRRRARARASFAPLLLERRSRDSRRDRLHEENHAPSLRERRIALECRFHSAARQ